MPTPVVMPKLGLSMKAGTISSWRAGDGAAVETGQTIFVVETDKINMEIEATASGTLKHSEPEGVTVPTGHLIAYILAPGEDLPADGVAAPSTSPGAAAAPAAVAPTQASSSDAAQTTRVLASPVARKLAEQLGVDLATVTGTGPGGRVVKEDVEAAAANAPEEAAAPAAATGTTTPAEPGDPDERRPLSAMRRTISDRMSASLRESAQLTIGTEVDITDLVRLIDSMTPGADADSPAPTITDYLVLAVTRALRRHPAINSSLDGDTVVLHRAVHLGLAVALSEGLVVPVLRDVQSRSIGEIAADRRSLAEAARSGRLSLDDLSGSTFTISSLGQSRVTWFTPILNPPEAAILGVGRAVEQARFVDGSVAARSVLPLSLTIDHRLIDGAPAAAFLDELSLSLSEPLRLLA